MRIDPFERELLRDRALDRWQQSKAARHDAAQSARRHSTKARSEMLRAQAGVVHARAEEAVARAARLVEDATILRGSAVHATTLELLADRAIRGGGRNCRPRRGPPLAWRSPRRPAWANSST